MTEIRISGASDDLIEVSVDGVEDEFNTYKSWAGRLNAPNGEVLVVTATYGKHNDCWVIGVTKNGEDSVFPEWPMRFVQADCDYSVELVIDAPDGTTLVEL